MNVLMDTGPWVALVDRSESLHVECIKWLEQFRGSIFSTEAVLTEVLYLLNFSSAAQFAALDFVLTGAVEIVPASIAGLQMAKNFMEKFADLPMDFADATIVTLAHDLAINHIVTFDKKHFSIYRLFKSQPFLVMP